MHFCESMGTFGAKCSCAKGYKLLEDGRNCDPESISIFSFMNSPLNVVKVTLYSTMGLLFSHPPAEFPCGRTAMAPSGSAFTRSLLGHENASLENATSTTSPPSTPAGTTASLPATSEPTTIRSRKKLPWWRHVGAGPTEEPPRALKRIVGGEVVIPGEIPWQVLYRSRGVKSDACKAFGSGSA